MAELEVFIDDSGDCETCLSYTALVMIQGSAAKALNDFDAAIDPLVAMFELGNDFELHGSVLLGDTRLAEYQREFPFRHALDRIARFPTLTVATVHWDWSPAAFRKPADPRAWRHRVLWRRLLAMLDEIALAQYDVPCDITAITTDATNNADRILEEHTRYVAARPNTRILSSPVFEDSTTNRLLQAADLCAFSADLWARPCGRNTSAKGKADPRPALGHDWHPLSLRERFAYCLPDSGIRKFKGPEASK